MSNLTAIETELAQTLGDPARRTYTAAALDVAIAGALSDLRQAAGQPLALAGLEGAAETTLSTAELRMLVLGAAALALLTRAAARSETTDLSNQIPADLFRLAEDFSRRFEAGLRRVQAAYGQRSDAPPYSPWDEPKS